MQDVRRDKFFGLVVSKKKKFIWLRLYCRIKERGIVDKKVLAHPSFDDLRVGRDLVEKLKGAYLIGDKAYQSKERKEEL